MLLYSRPDKPKLRNIAANPRVSLHLDGDGRGGDIVVVTGSAAVSDDAPASQMPAYVAKYAGLIERQRLDARQLRRRLLGADADRGRPPARPLSAQPLDSPLDGLLHGDLPWPRNLAARFPAR